MSSVAGKKILLGIAGSIAAYKAPLLLRLLKKAGADVHVIMTESAKDFVTPLTLSTLSDHPVHCEPFNKDNGAWDSHVELGRWADLFVVAPVSANTLAKMANGIADNHLVTTYLASKCPVCIAPAMDLDMYYHPTTHLNLKTLKSFGVQIIEPNEGPLASGLCGAGRMEEPEEIFKYIEAHFDDKRSLKGVKALVSAGPTYEAIDAVRFIGNHSSGLMGIRIAETLADKGAEVQLVCGPSSIKTDHPGVFRIDVKSAEEMYNACMELHKDNQIIVMSAAVADYTVDNPQPNKIKKSDKAPEIKLVPTKDILANLGAKKAENQFLVGFALETDNEIENAKKKLNNKNLDFVVLNSLKDDGAGFSTSTNKVRILDKKGNQFDYPLKSKKEVAGDIVNQIIEAYIK
jgi:phosphopantothenoylcysteine decarboxylase/phosphopantothenate--cysteine ligase